MSKSFCHKGLKFIYNSKLKMWKLSSKDMKQIAFTFEIEPHCKKNYINSKDTYLARVNYFYDKDLLDSAIACEESPQLAIDQCIINLHLTFV